MEANTTKSAPFTLSFMSANYVAKELGYGAADEWGPFDDATNAAFEPLEYLRGALRRPAHLDHRHRLRRGRPLVRASELALGDTRPRRDRA